MFGRAWLLKQVDPNHKGVMSLLVAVDVSSRCHKPLPSSRTISPNFSHLQRQPIVRSLEIPNHLVAKDAIFVNRLRHCSHSIPATNGGKSIILVEE